MNIFGIFAFLTAPPAPCELDDEMEQEEAEELDIDPEVIQ